MSSIDDVATLIKDLSQEDRAKLVAALLTVETRSTHTEILIPDASSPVPEPEQLTPETFVPQSAPGMTGSLQDPPPSAPPERLDTPEDRARLLAILMVHSSGISEYALLDNYHIPPQTIELARREGQAGRAERGLGLTIQWGGAWAPDTDNIDHEAIKRYEAMFREKLQQS